MKYSIIGLFILGLTMIISCGNTEDDYVFYPKPISSQKVIFPEKSYEKYASDCNFSFEIPVYSEFVKDTSADNCNGNIEFKNFNATMHLTHIKVDSNLMYNIEYSRKLAYDHSIKADEGIDEAVVINSEHNVYGLQYKIKGNAASNYQFYLTDSTDHFLRGALYFNSVPNYDSLKPTLDFIMDDFDHLIKTMTWK